MAERSKKSNTNMLNPFTKKAILAREIILTLIVKFTIIFLLWLWFFSSPIDETLDTNKVQTAIFGTQSAIPNKTGNRNNRLEDE